LDSRELNEETAEKLLLWLRAMSRKDLSPENLIADFGPESEPAAKVVGVLAKLVDSGKHPESECHLRRVAADLWHRLRDKNSSTSATIIHWLV